HRPLLHLHAFLHDALPIFSQLLVLRFVTGLAMGAIIPNAMALAGEFSPARFRVTLMMIVSSGFIIGGAIGGGVAALLIPAFGWRDRKSTRLNSSHEGISYA